MIRGPLVGNILLRPRRLDFLSSRLSRADSRGARFSDCCGISPYKCCPSFAVPGAPLCRADSNTQGVVHAVLARGSVRHQPAEFVKGSGRRPSPIPPARGALLGFGVVVGRARARPPSRSPLSAFERANNFRSLMPPSPLVGSPWWLASVVVGVSPSALPRYKVLRHTLRIHHSSQLHVK